jgi:SOS-response transcriptional repressor LexA
MAGDTRSLKVWRGGAKPETAWRGGRNPKTEPGSIERETLGTIVALTEELGYVPSYREIGKRLGLESSKTVWSRIEWLEGFGLVTWPRTGSHRSSRAMVVTAKGKAFLEG